jgi:5'-3' exonuclease
MIFIRSYRGKYPDQFIQEMHCMYAMDAHLMMLALSTHIPSFIFLKEHVLINVLLEKYVFFQSNP